MIGQQVLAVNLGRVKARPPSVEVESVFAEELL
jgi:hypothetical protein